MFFARVIAACLQDSFSMMCIINYSAHAHYTNTSCRSIMWLRTCRHVDLELFSLRTRVAGDCACEPSPILWASKKNRKLSL